MTSLESLFLKANSLGTFYSHYCRKTFCWLRARLQNNKHCTTGSSPPPTASTNANLLLVHSTLCLVPLAALRMIFLESLGKFSDLGSDFPGSSTLTQQCRFQNSHATQWSKSCAVTLRSPRLLVLAGLPASNTSDKTYVCMVHPSGQPLYDQGLCGLHCGGELFCCGGSRLPELGKYNIFGLEMLLSWFVRRHRQYKGACNERLLCLVVAVQAPRWAAPDGCMC